MTGKALVKRLARLKRQRVRGDLDRLSDAELQARLDALLARLPADIRDALAPYQLASDYAGAKEVLRQFIGAQSDVQSSESRSSPSR